MVALKDYIVLDFLEWFYKKKRDFLYVDRLEYDNSYNEQILEYAHEYLVSLESITANFDAVQPKLGIIDILDLFLHSKEFSNEIGYSSYNINSEKSIEMFSSKFGQMIYNLDLATILKRYRWKVLRQSDEDVDERQLIDSIKVYYKCPNYTKYGAEFCKSQLMIIEGFLDFLDKKNISVNFRTIPQEKLLNFINLYCNRNLENKDWRKNDHSYNNDQELNTIFKALKDNNFEKMLIYFKRKISNDKLIRYKNLEYLYDRYTNPEVRFKCLILPIKGDMKFNKFINRYWDDLDESSGDYLDIFVSKQDVEISGYESIKKIKDLCFLDLYELPCFVIWENDLSEAISINIFGLNFEQIHLTFQKIINVIKNGGNKEEIVKESNKVISEFREYNRRILTIKQDMKYNSGTVIGLQINSFDIDYLIETEVQCAINKLEKLNLDSIIKKRAIGLLHNARSIILKKDDIYIEQACKERFKKYICGKDSEIIIEALKEYIFIRSFFNLNYNKERIEGGL